MSRRRRSIRPGKRFLVLMRDNFTCRYCGARPMLGLSVDPGEDDAL